MATSSKALHQTQYLQTYRQDGTAHTTQPDSQNNLKYSQHVNMKNVLYYNHVRHTAVTLKSGVFPCQNIHYIWRKMN